MSKWRGRGREMTQVENRAVVLNLLRLEDHLHILYLGRGPPLKIVSWKIAKLVCLCFYNYRPNCKMKKVTFARGPPGRWPRYSGVRGPQVENRWSREFVRIRRKRRRRRRMRRRKKKKRNVRHHNSLSNLVV